MVYLHGSSAACVSDCKAGTNPAYLKKGWEGTYHHDNTGRSRMYGVKKMEAMLCILICHLSAEAKCAFVCEDELKDTHTDAKKHKLRTT